MGLFDKKKKDNDSSTPNIEIDSPIMKRLGTNIMVAFLREIPDNVAVSSEMKKRFGKMSLSEFTMWLNSHDIYAAKDDIAAFKYYFC